ncbi:MAG: hypothetical protein IKS83_04225 [Victivallales bacterium]|nr:hypothetical protein [Victivallales bacterium]
MGGSSQLSDCGVFRCRFASAAGAGPTALSGAGTQACKQILWKPGEVCQAFDGRFVRLLVAAAVAELL